MEDIMDMIIRNCYFCDKQITINDEPRTRNKYCECLNCDKYNLSYELSLTIENESVYKNNISNLYLISGYLRETTEKGIDIGLITLDKLNNLFASMNSPKKLSEKVNMILLYLLDKTEYF